MGPAADTPSARPVVLDTNIVLDLLVYADARYVSLWQAVQQAQLRWIASAAMLEELARVLAYPHLQRWMQQHGKNGLEVLIQAHAHAEVLPPAPVAGARCRDPDDQKFIDLACAHQACLFSKDKEVLRLGRTLRAQGVTVSAIFPLKI